MTVLLIGTCRVYDPGRILRFSGESSVLVPGHRMHTAAQALQLVNALTGERIYDAGNIHLLSDLAFRLLLEGRKETALRRLDRLAAKIGRRKRRAVIEICSWWDFLAPTPAGPFLVNTFSKRFLQREHAFVDDAVRRGEMEAIRAADIEARPASEETILRDMLSIKQRLQCPILWVGHINVDDPDPRFDPVRKARAPLNELVRENARKLDDDFFDPSEPVNRLGRRSMLAEGGEDLAHYNPVGLVTIAGELQRRLGLTRDLGAAMSAANGNEQAAPIAWMQALMARSRRALPA